MKILIITYSREVNPGTFLQAYGVQHVFRQLYPGAEIDLIKHKRMYSIAKEMKGKAGKVGRMAFIKSKVKAVPRRLKYEWAYRTKFHLTEREFGFFDYDDAEFKAFAEGYDLIVVGSDTILIRLENNGHYGLMWLRGIDTQKILFAASAAPVNYMLTEQQKTELKESFSTFGLLGVRDDVTKHLLADVVGLGDKVYTQYDPTYLIPESEFALPYFVRKKLERIGRKQKIALVNFSAGCAFKRELTAFLKQQGYYTICTLYNEDADCNLMSLTPFGWAAMFRYVDLSVTERFHDSVFTLRNGKPVVAVDSNPDSVSPEGLSKRQDLLKRYGLECNHFVANTIEEAAPMMEHITQLPFAEQRAKIKEHNQYIKENYAEIMHSIENTLKAKMHASSQLGGGKSCPVIRLSSPRETYRKVS